ncbi:hypothetical protein DFH08DRAFT_841110 [Mycena albidolilacea]|uniref:Uncharacterized protein n=1 Tax=Mycena albidolilacea TaxID=1033008 RepID=A0AAD7ALM1_9AGAR|nr:hypothetical protein DFH08DRAFT_841110 [Mycena albidolilacea]
MLLAQLCRRPPIPCAHSPESSSHRPHHPFLMAPLALVLMPVGPSLGPCHWKHLIPPAYVVHARTSFRPSVHEGVFRRVRERVCATSTASQRSAAAGQRGRTEDGRGGCDGRRRWVSTSATPPTPIANANTFIPWHRLLDARLKLIVHGETGRRG